MIRFLTAFIVVFSALALIVAGLPALAQTNIFLTPNSKQQQNNKKDTDTPLFLPKKKAPDSKGSFISKLFNKPETVKAANLVPKLGAPSKGLGFDFDRFYAEYKKAENLDPEILKDEAGPQTAEDLNALAAYRKAPLVMAMLEHQQKIETHPGILYKTASLGSEAAGVPRMAPKKYSGGVLSKAKRQGGGQVPLIYVDPDKPKRDRKVFSDY
jgi:hypothetical protein